MPSHSPDWLLNDSKMIGQMATLYHDWLIDLKMICQVASLYHDLLIDLKIIGKMASLLPDRLSVDLKMNLV